MPYQNNPAGNMVDRVRLAVGDIWDDMEILKDADYEYFLSKYEGSERRAAMDAARAILFKVSRYSRERTGDIEVYGSEWFKNYMNALKLVLVNPDIAISVAVPYAGGISKTDMYANDLNQDNAVREIFIGFTENRKLYDQCNPTYDLPRTLF